MSSSLVRFVIRYAAMICCGIAVGQHMHSVFHGICTALAMSALFPVHIETT